MMATVPIAELEKAGGDAATKSIRAVVTLIWPYSSSTRRAALLLAEPDFRLRKSKGQVRVQLAGLAAEEVAKSKISSGDEVVLSLIGARWVEATAGISTPGRSVDVELEYSRRIICEIFRDGLPFKKLDVQDDPVTESQSRSASPATRHIRIRPLSTPHLDRNSGLSTPVSSAFHRRARVISGELVDSPYDPFAGDREVLGHSRKRQRQLQRLSWSSDYRWTVNDNVPSPSKKQKESDWIQEVDLQYPANSPVRKRAEPTTPTSPAPPSEPREQEQTSELLTDHATVSLDCHSARQNYTQELVDLVSGDTEEEDFSKLVNASDYEDEDEQDVADLAAVSSAFPTTKILSGTKFTVFRDDTQERSLSSSLFGEYARPYVPPEPQLQKSPEFELPHTHVIDFLSSGLVKSEHASRQEPEHASGQQQGDTAQQRMQEHAAGVKESREDQEVAGQSKPPSMRITDMPPPALPGPNTSTLDGPLSTSMPPPPAQALPGSPKTPDLRPQQGALPLPSPFPGDELSSYVDFSPKVQQSGFVPPDASTSPIMPDWMMQAGFGFGSQSFLRDSPPKKSQSPTPTSEESMQHGRQLNEPKSIRFQGLGVSQVVKNNAEHNSDAQSKQDPQETRSSIFPVPISYIEPALDAHHPGIKEARSESQQDSTLDDEDISLLEADTENPAEGVVATSRNEQPVMDQSDAFSRMPSQIARAMTPQTDAKHENDVDAPSDLDQDSSATDESEISEHEDESVDEEEEVSELDASDEASEDEEDDAGSVIMTRSPGPSHVDSNETSPPSRSQMPIVIDIFDSDEDDEQQPTQDMTAPATATQDGLQLLKLAGQALQDSVTTEPSMDDYIEQPVSDAEDAVPESLAEMLTNSLSSDTANMQGVGSSHLPSMPTRGGLSFTPPMAPRKGTLDAENTAAFEPQPLMALASSQKHHHSPRLRIEETFESTAHSDVSLTTAPPSGGSEQNELPVVHEARKHEDSPTQSQAPYVRPNLSSYDGTRDDGMAFTASSPLVEPVHNAEELSYTELLAVRDETLEAKTETLKTAQNDTDSSHMPFTPDAIQSGTYHQLVHPQDVQQPDLLPTPHQTQLEQSHSEAERGKDLPALRGVDNQLEPQVQITQTTPLGTFTHPSSPVSPPTQWSGSRSRQSFQTNVEEDRQTQLTATLKHDYPSQIEQKVVEPEAIKSDGAVNDACTSTTPEQLIKSQVEFSDFSFTQSQATQARGLLTSYSYYTPLGALFSCIKLPSNSQSYNDGCVDVIAIVTKAATKPMRAEKGQRDFYTTLSITDEMFWPRSLRVQVFRPWRDALPKAEKGDAILLRGFEVFSSKGGIGVGLKSADSSAWCVWRNTPETSHDSVERKDLPWTKRAQHEEEDVRGPPVEFGDEERDHAHELKMWWQDVASHDMSSAPVKARV